MQITQSFTQHNYKKIVIYGASTIGVMMLNNLALDYEIIALIDKDENKQSHENPQNALFVGDKKFEVLPPSYLKNLEADCVIITIDSAFVPEVLEIIRESKIKNVHIVNDGIFTFPRKSFICNLSKMLLSRGVKGAVAELGVYKGELAKYLNAYFKDDILYLIDTFLGFDERDTKLDNENKLSSASVGDFSDTSLESVKAKMPYIQNCRFIQGYFPQTCSLIPQEETFKFVNLDVDLYQPIYVGLEYFYPRLSKGGIILIHDYTSIFYSGVQKAVDEFAAKNNLDFYPCGDGYSVFFIKS